MLDYTKPWEKCARCGHPESAHGAPKKSWDGCRITPPERRGGVCFCMQFERSAPAAAGER